jgi:hypothetical protein
MQALVVTGEINQNGMDLHNHSTIDFNRIITEYQQS